MSSIFEIPELRKTGINSKPFFVKVSNKGCWEVVSHKPHKTGYIYLWKDKTAHRLSYITFIGEVPDGLLVLHHCDNRKCVRPSHLFVGTNADNMQDKINKGRQPIGEKAGGSKLTEKQAKEVLDLKGRYTQRALSKMYGIAHSNIGAIHRRTAWMQIGEREAKINK